MISFQLSCHNCMTLLIVCFSIGYFIDHRDDNFI